MPAAVNRYSFVRKSLFGYLVSKNEYSKRYFFGKFSEFWIFSANFLYIIVMDIAAFWYRVKVLIKAHNVNQEKFAAYIGMPLSTLKGWMYHNRTPDVGTAYAIASALGVTVDYLVLGKENDTAEEDKKRRSTVKEAAARLITLQDQIQDNIGLINGYF